MADRITRCPHCSTSFRVSDSHLQIANGAVRCGACLQIFQAREHMLDKPAAPLPAATSQPTAAAKPAQPDLPADPLDDDDLLISDDMGDEDSSLSFEGELTADFAKVGSTHANRTLFDRELRPAAEQQETNNDESWAEELLREETESLTAAAKSAPRAYSAGTFALIEPLEEPDFGEPHVGNPKSADLGLAEPDFTEPKPAQTTPSAPAKPATKTSTQPAKDTGTAIQSEQSPRSAATPTSTAPSDAIEADLALEPEDHAAIYADSSDRSALLNQIELDAVELHANPGRSASTRPLLWLGLSLVAGVILALQAGWLLRDSFNWPEPVRGVYQNLCPWLGCELPEVYDTSRIKTYNLVVRSHPRTANALIVDAMLLNNSSRGQPFPALQLTFSDLNNQVVASRRFDPSEYLAGELAGSTSMPPNQPVHIALEIVDPGSSAVNYRLDISQ